MKQLLFTLCIACVLHAQEQNDTLHINLVSNSKGFARNFLQAFYNAVTDSMDRIPSYHFYPEKRAALMMQNGMLDIDAARTIAFKDKYPSTIRVPVHFMSTRILAITTDSTLKLSNEWATLSQKDLRIDYIRGMAIAEQKVPQYVPKKQLYAVNNVNSGMQRLRAKRCDIFICPQPLSRTWFMNNPKSKKEFIEAATLDNIPVYPYLSYHSRQYSTKLENTIKSMLASNAIDSLFKETLEKWMTKNRALTTRPDSTLIPDEK